MHLARRVEPFGAVCGVPHGTFSAAADAVTCLRCLAAATDDPTLAQPKGYPSALVTHGAPVPDVDPATRRRLDQEMLDQQRRAAPKHGAVTS